MSRQRQDWVKEILAKNPRGLSAKEIQTVMLGEQVVPLKVSMQKLQSELLILTERGDIKRKMVRKSFLYWPGEGRVLVDGMVLVSRDALMQVEQTLGDQDLTSQAREEAHELVRDMLGLRSS